jgi:hypothetical protein
LAVTTGAIVSSWLSVSAAGSDESTLPVRERISSAFVEATVNAVIGKCFAKKQQMQWSRRGAHLLLQERTKALDGTLRATFDHWYRGLMNDNSGPDDRAAA